MKHTFWVLAFVFVLFAAVQYNDPDPIPWIALYGIVAAHFGLAALGRTYRLAIWITLATALLWAISLLPEFVDWINMGAPTIVGSMKAEEPWIEYTREFLGLGLAALACGFLLRTNKVPE
ncbi:MAG: transmembrane 220 family protein [Saprospiraceae bacterium]